MGLLSAVAVIVALLLLALVLGKWATISAGVVGVILLVCAILVALDLLLPVVSARRGPPQ